MMIKIRNSYIYKLLAAKIHKNSVRRNPVNEMRRVYYKVFHKYPNLENPLNLIEKIYWMQLHTDTSMWTRCADKYAMREYVKECGYEGYLPFNYGKWDKVEDIDFSVLPNEFVLKTNNGCGTVLIVRDKNTLNEKAICKKLQQWLNIPFGWAGAELHYTRIKPCVIAEELLRQDEEQKALSPHSQIDYKVWCINGEPESVFVAYNRHDISYINIALFDTSWNPMPHYLKSNNKDQYNPSDIISKPACLEEMLSMAKKMSKPFPEVRIDFYVVDNKPIIGELTFTSGYGYFTEDYYLYLGEKIDLSKIIVSR